MENQSKAAAKAADYMWQESDDPIWLKYMWKIDPPRNHSALAHNEALKAAIREARVSAHQATVNLITNDMMSEDMIKALKNHHDDKIMAEGFKTGWNEANDAFARGERARAKDLSKMVFEKTTEEIIGKHEFSGGYTNHMELSDFVEDINEARHNGFEAGKLAEHKVMGRKEDIPDKCEKCGGRLNLWIGSHTAVRSQTLGFDKDGHYQPKVVWTCTDCFLKMFKGEIMKEGADRARASFRKLVQERIDNENKLHYGRNGIMPANSVILDFCNDIIAKLNAIEKADIWDRNYNYTWICPKCKADKLVLTDDFISEKSSSFYCEGCNTDFRKEGFSFDDRGNQSYNKGYTALCKHIISKNAKCGLCGAEANIEVDKLIPIDMGYYHNDKDLGMMIAVCPECFKRLKESKSFFSKMMPCVDCFGGKNEEVGVFHKDSRPKDIPKFSVVKRTDGRIEVQCEHGVGHTIFAPRRGSMVHGCDFCCSKPDFIAFAAKVDLKKYGVAVKG